jgi:hypothetical protein
LEVGDQVLEGAVVLREVVLKTACIFKVFPTRKSYFCCPRRYISCSWKIWERMIGDGICMIL